MSASATTRTATDGATAPPLSRRVRWSPGRLVGLTLAGAGIALQASALVRAVGALPDAGASGAAALAAAGLSLVVYVLMVGAYLLRTTEVATDPSPVARTVAVATTFSPFLMPLWAGRTQPAAVEVLACVLLTGGLAGCVWSLRHLARSFSVLPQARTLVSTGPYRLVRHPLYTTEILANLGMAVHFGRPVHAMVLTVLMLGQVYRARREERLLCEHVPGYAEYRRRTAGLVPGLW